LRLPPPTPASPPPPSRRPEVTSEMALALDDLGEFHDVEQEHHAAARMQAIARGRSDRRLLKGKQHAVRSEEEEFGEEIARKIVADALVASAIAKGILMHLEMATASQNSTRRFSVVVPARLRAGATMKTLLDGRVVKLIVPMTLSASRMIIVDETGQVICNPSAASAVPAEKAAAAEVAAALARDVASIQTHAYLGIYIPTLGSAAEKAEKAANAGKVPSTKMEAVGGKKVEAVSGGGCCAIM